jgi:type III secretion protein T
VTLFGDWAPQQALFEAVFRELDFLVLATALPFGLSLLFAVFAWAHLNSGVLRMVFAIAVALPVFVPLAGPLSTGVEPSLPFPYVIVLLKELGIGALLGWAGSVPFAIAASSGHIMDGYRGGTSGDSDPTGGQITPFAKLCAVIILSLFAKLGGFWIIVDAIYTSYSIWPIFDPTPIATTFQPRHLLEVLETLVRSALVIAGPIITIMMATDIAFLFSTKFGKQINVSQLAFSVKNTVALMLLPIYSTVLIGVYSTQLGSLRQLAQVVASWFR